MLLLKLAYEANSSNQFIPTPYVIVTGQLVCPSRQLLGGCDRHKLRQAGAIAVRKTELFKGLAVVLHG